jgi:hypothetical protein
VTELPDEHPDQPPRTPLQVGWIVFALLLLGLLLSGWFLITGAQHPVAGRATTPPMIGGGGTINESPTASTTFAQPPKSLPIPLPPSLPVPPGGEFGVSGVDNERTIACNDHDITVSGVDNTVTLTGHCGRVEISGMENTVVIDSAAAITVSGINNKVTFHSGSPILAKSGIDNTLEKG